MQADQGGRQQPERQQQPDTGRDALGVEVVSEQQEVTEHDDDHGISSRLQFEQFHCHENHQHGDAGIASEQGAELDQDAATAGNDEQDQRPAAGQALVLPPQAYCPAQQQQACRAQPVSLVRSVR
ncbi:hypothetical protein SDC9_188329 [bioreactor metagenome]|uniref:Uncharacterized protein n=1 Tax=bioreactor metagenome TaxID=1076179 RepID=A0A645HPM2_9ZZZZ